MTKFDIADLSDTPQNDDPGPVKIVAYIAAIIVLGCLAAILIAVTVRVVHWIV